MSEFVTPKKIEVQQMLGMLYDNQITVVDSAPIEEAANDKTIVAVFVDDNDAPVTVCTCDFSFTAYAGGALTKIPKPGTDEAAESGEFSPMLLGNLYEVMNICSRLFMSSATPHLRLEKTYQPGEAMPDGVDVLIKGDGKSVAGFTVNIDGYGDGALTFVAS